MYAREGSESAELRVEVSFSELPYVQITPSSPAFFLKFIWEKIQMLATRESRERAMLAIRFAGKRLAEAIKYASKEENLKSMEELFQKRIKLLKMAYQLSGEDKEVRRELLKQVLLGDKFLKESKESAPTEERRKDIQALIEKRTQWLGDLESSLGDPETGVLSTEKMRVFESTMAAGVKGEFIENLNWQERIERLIFGVKMKILSPYPVPERL